MYIFSFSKKRLKKFVIKIQKRESNLRLIQ